MTRSDHFRVAAGGTIHLYGNTVAIRQIVLSSSSAGTTWIVKIQDRASTPAVLIVPNTVTLPTDGFPLKVKFDDPVPMEAGIDFVTVSGTPGVADLWITTDQP